MTTETLTLIERTLWTAVALMPLAAAFRSLWMERRVSPVRRPKPAGTLLPARPPVAA